MLKSLTFNEFIELLETKTSFKFHPFGELYQDFSIDIYKDCVPKLKNILKMRYGNSELLFAYDDKVDIQVTIVGVYEQIKERFALIKYENEYKWKTLFNSTLFDYEPLNNAILDETQTVTTSVSSLIGRRVDVTENESTLGIQTEYYTETDQASAFDTETYRNTDKKVNEVTKDETVNSDSSSVESGEQLNRDFGTVTTTNSRRGSIGVITNQDMIQKERAVAMINFCEIMAFDLIKGISFYGYF